MPVKKEPITFAPKDRMHWRTWLSKNHRREEAVWLVYHKKNSKTPSLEWDHAVEEALCFGWIDSKRQPLDDTTFRQLFTKRKPKGTWSKINKARVARLSKEGLMAEAGLEAVEVARKNGAWSLLDDVEELSIPPDLEKALRKRKGSKKFFESLARSIRRMALLSLVMAKRPETRQKRVEEIAEKAAKGIK